jgi:hypothetical protein
MTVNQLLGNLRDALAGLVPVAERAHIAWRDGEAYDDWDHLASCAYEVLVRRPISADTSAAPVVLPLAPYDMVLPDYRGYTCLVLETNPGCFLLFNRLLAGEGDFAEAETRALALDGTLLDVQPVEVPIATGSWKLLRRRRDGSTELADLVAPER